MDDKRFSFLSHLPLTRRAVRYAERRHGNQRRVADGAPFVLHLLEAASLLGRSGYPDQVVAAAILHDTLEDTDASRNQLAVEFGLHVAELVAIVSDDPAISDEEERKDEVRERVQEADDEAIAVYAADKISKVRELRLLMSRDPEDPQIELRLRRYRKSLEMLEDQIPGSRLTEILRFELEALEGLPTRVSSRVP
jgi:(p)ppGpp synthase/HD superfamily hydrolase